MIPHVHTPSQKVETWGVNGMKSHLEHDHPEVQLPMAWDLGELHQAHLMAHQTPEEKPMTPCGAENPQYPGEYTCEYPAGHGPVTDPDDGDMPITGTFDHGAPSKGVWWTMLPAGTAEADKVENLAQLLYERNASSTETDWDDLGQETRDHYRDRARTSLVRVRDGRANRVNQAEPTEGERQILEDRLIAAMIGMDFDNQWAADSGIGSAVRGSYRNIYGEAAKRLLRWLEHGGAMHLTPVANLAEDLTTAQKLQYAAESDRDKAAQDLFQERLLVRDLEETNNQLHHQLADSEQRRQGLFEGMGELRQQLETAVATRDRALEAGRLLEAQRDEVSCARDAALDERDAARRDAETARLQRDRARATLKSGQAALGDLLRGLNQGTVPLTSGGVMARLEGILASSRLTLAPVTEKADLGLATTGELIEEVRTRIDLGHCGLEYRTVDDD